MKNNHNLKKIIIWSLLIVVIVLLYFTPYFIGLFSARHAKTLDIMPTPQKNIKLEYEYDVVYEKPSKEYLAFKEEYKKKGITLVELAKIKDGKYLYYGNKDSMTFFDSGINRVFFYSDNALYNFTNTGIDKNDHIIYNYDKKSGGSVVRVDRENDILEDIAPLLGIYQPGQYIFSYSSAEYKDGKIQYIYPNHVIFKYNDEGLVSYIISPINEQYFDSYKYIESIDMTIPTKIIWKKYRLVPNNDSDKVSQKDLLYTCTISLTDAEEISGGLPDILKLQNPPGGVTVSDLRFSQSSVTYTYDKSMKSIEDKTKKELKLEKINVKTRKGLDSILKVISFIAIVFILYLIISKLNRARSRHE